ncbi:MAG: DNA gyrase inhibitor YacG [Caldiserica bacterium]|nr:DNA gyrase inhibitor YacG [Caldisericota bacterium]
MPGTKVKGNQGSDKICKKVRCSYCKKEITWQEGDPLPPYFPFCSARCKLVDLGSWLEEEYRIKEYFSRREAND